MRISRNKTKVVTTIVMILLMASMTVLSFPVSAQNNLAAGIVPTNVKGWNLNGSTKRRYP